MTQQIINLGAAGSGAGGDTARTAFEKIIANFAELYPAALPDTAAQKQAAREMFGAENASNLTSGTLPDARVSSTLPADKAFRRGNILGTVSQSGGVPTGAIIERGSNANGEYTRYADGTQECWSPIITSVGVAVTTAAAGGFRGTQNEWQFPAAFSSPPTCVHSTRASTHQQGELRALSTTSMQPSAWCATSNPSVSCAYQAYAVGRWY